MKKLSYEIGIDEAGRGPLAGPVSVGAVIFKTKDKSKLKRVFKKIKGKDSKKLTARAREEWFKIIKNEEEKGNLHFTVSFVSARTIDERGIVFAIKTAIEDSLKKIKADPKDARVLLDGGLRASQKYRHQKTIIRGDESELSISLASIAAKVLRDRKMARLSQKYPLYGFDKHKGYGTKYHCEQILKYGPSCEHRVSFLTKILDN
jgi:ribonuclease HII